MSFITSLKQNGSAYVSSSQLLRPVLPALIYEAGKIQNIFTKRKIYLFVDWYNWINNRFRTSININTSLMCYSRGFYYLCTLVIISSFYFYRDSMLRYINSLITLCRRQRKNPKTTFSRLRNEKVVSWARSVIRIFI